MHLLEDWIKQLLLQSVDEINNQYSESGLIDDEVRSLIETHEQKRCSSVVSDHVLEALHQKMRGHRCEDDVWDAIAFQLCHPLPLHIAHDLIDRDVAVCALGHTRQVDEVQWRLAALVDEALLTLARDFYTNPRYSAAELQQLLNQYPNHSWLLRSWSYWNGESREKDIIFHQWAWNHSERPDSLYSPEQYLEILVAQERKEQEYQAQLEREAEDKRRQLEHIAKDSLTLEEIKFILLCREPESLTAFAGNPQVPDEWIRKLLNCYNVKGARQIREAAAANLKNRA